MLGTRPCPRLRARLVALVGIAVGALAVSAAATQGVARVDHAGGSFVDAGGGRWEERNAAGEVAFVFRETGRDASVIHLFDAGRDAYIDLDVASGWIRYKGGASGAFGNLYEITGTATAAPDVSRIDRVDHAAGRFERRGDGRWEERDASGRVGFTFDETGRDATTIHLVDPSRGVSIDLDVAGGHVLYKGSASGEFQRLYAITDTGSASGESGGPGAVELRIANQTDVAIEVYTEGEEAYEQLTDDVPGRGETRVAVSPGQRVVVFYADRDDVLHCHDVTGASAQTFTVTPAGGTCGGADTATAEAPEPNERPRQWRPEILPWLRAEQPEEPALRQTPKDAFSGELVPYPYENSIAGLDYFAYGYNILKMNPADLRQRGGTRLRVFQKLETDDYKYYRTTGSYKLATPNYLEIFFGRSSRSEGLERTSFSDSTQAKSSGYTVGLGASPPKGPSGDISVGVSRSEENVSREQRMLIREEALITTYWAVQAKEHLRLSRSMRKRLGDPEALDSDAEFDRFFEDFGTHYPLATLMGGWARRDTTYALSEVGRTLAKSLDVSGSGGGTIKGVDVKSNFSYNESSTNTTGSGESTRRTRTESTAQTQGDSFTLDLGPPGQDENYVPAGVELRPTWELVWPELMGRWRKAPVEGDPYREVYEEVRDPQEIARIDRLRARLRTQLDRYLREKSRTAIDDEEWKPRIFRARFSHVRVTEANDGAGNNEFYGAIRIGDAGGYVEVWSHPTESQEVEVEENADFVLNAKNQQGLRTSVTPRYVEKKGPLGETYYVPDWEQPLRDAKVTFALEIVEAEDGDDEPFSPGERRRTLSLWDVDQANGLLQKTYTMENSEARIEFRVRLEEIDYELGDNATKIEIPSFGELRRFLTPAVSFDRRAMPSR